MKIKLILIMPLELTHGYFSDSSATTTIRQNLIFAIALLLSFAIFSSQVDAASYGSMPEKSTFETAPNQSLQLTKTNQNGASQNVEIKPDILGLSSYYNHFTNGISKTSAQHKKLYDYLKSKDPDIDKDQNGTISLDEFTQFGAKRPNFIEYIYEIDLVLQKEEKYIDEAAIAGKVETLKRISADESLPPYLRNSAGSHVYSKTLFVSDLKDLYGSVSAWLQNGGNPNIFDDGLTLNRIWELDDSPLDHVMKYGVDYKWSTGNPLPGALQTLQLLLDHGANLNITNCFGETPLFTAVITDNPEAVKLFIDRGVSVNHRSMFGWNAYDIAKYNNNNKVLKLFESVAIDKTGPKESHLPFYLRYVPFDGEYDNLGNKKFNLRSEFLLNFRLFDLYKFTESTNEPMQDNYYFIQKTNFGTNLEGCALLTLFSYDKKDIHIDNSFGQYMRNSAENSITLWNPAHKDEVDYFRRPVASPDEIDAFRKGLIIEYGQLLDQAAVTDIVYHPRNSSIYRVSKANYDNAKIYLTKHFSTTKTIKDSDSLKELFSDFKDVLSSTLGALAPLDASGFTIYNGKYLKTFHDAVDLAEAQLPKDGIYLPANNLDYLQKLTDLRPEDLDLRATSADKVEGTSITYVPRKIHFSLETTVTPVKYVGEIVDNMPHGKGTLYSVNIPKIVGFFVHGLPHGPYMAFNGDTLTESGTYNNGKKDGLITTYFEPVLFKGIRAQRTFKNDLLTDGPLVVNQINYETGLIKGAEVREIRNGISVTTRKDVVNVRAYNHMPITKFNEELFGLEGLKKPVVKSAFTQIQGISSEDSEALRKELVEKYVLDENFLVLDPLGLQFDSFNLKVSDKYLTYKKRIIEVLKQSLTIEPFLVGDEISSALRKAQIWKSEGSGKRITNYIDSTADVSVDALAKHLRPKLKKYFPKLSSILKKYQSEYHETLITCGTKGYVVIFGKYTRYSDYNVDTDLFFGHATTIHSSGDSVEGQLDSRGDTYEGTVVYTYADDGTKLVGRFDPSKGRITGPAVLTYANGNTLEGNVDPDEGSIIGQATFTYYYEENKHKYSKTQTVTVGSNGFTYKTPIQLAHMDFKHGVKSAWDGLFHDGNIFKKIEDSVRLIRDGVGTAYTFVMVQANVNKLGFTVKVNEKGDNQYGVIIGKNGLGEFNLTLDGMNELKVLLFEDGNKKIALKSNFMNMDMSGEQSKSYSYAVQSNTRQLASNDNGLAFSVSMISPVVAEKNSSFTNFVDIKPPDVFDALFGQKFINNYRWTPEQKQVIEPSLRKALWSEKELEAMGKQLNGELLSTQLEHLYGMQAIEASFMTECISWSVERAKNGLKPEYQMKLYSLVALFKMYYDTSIWAKITDKTQSGKLDDRQKAIIYQSMEAIKEFEDLVNKKEIDPSNFKVAEPM